LAILLRNKDIDFGIQLSESEPFYGEQTDLSMLFEGLDHLSQLTSDQEFCLNTPTDATKDQHPPLMVGYVPISI
jgi:hypothetical protein